DRAFAAALERVDERPERGRRGRAGLRGEWLGTHRVARRTRGDIAHEAVRPVSGPCEESLAKDAPGAFVRVDRRPLIATRRLAEVKPLAVPSHASVRGRDDPAELAETLREKRRRRLDDVMLRRVPRHVR